MRSITELSLPAHFRVLGLHPCLVCGERGKALSGSAHLLLAFRLLPGGEEQANTAEKTVP